MIDLSVAHVNECNLQLSASNTCKFHLQITLANYICKLSVACVHQKLAFLFDMFFR